MVYWTFCILIVGSGYLVGLTASNPTPAPSVEPTSAAEKEVTTEGTTDKSDLDLETQDQVAILKQINRVNEDGSYTFGYEAADGSFKIETRDVAGNVKGMFGFVNDDGELKRVSYSASNGTGFQSTGTPNIPPLPGTSLDDPPSHRQVPTKLYQQIIRPRQYLADKTATTIDLLSTTPVTPTTRIPIFIYGSTTTPRPVSSTTARPVVIQHIPKVRPTPGSSTTRPTESEEVTTYGTYLPKKSSTPSYISFSGNDITSTTPASEGRSVVQVVRPRGSALKKILVTKRPVEVTTPRVYTTTDYPLGEEAEVSGNGLRRQLGYENFLPGDYTGLVTSGTEDSPDVYGATPTARPFPAQAYRQLFAQIPQHQRILQNSYLQNQNQYLAAALGAGIPIPGSSQGAPAPPQIAPQDPQPTGRPDIPPSAVGVPPQYLGQGYTPSPPQYTTPQQQYASPQQYTPQPQQYAPQPQQYAPQPQQYNPQPYIPPALMEQLLRMLLFPQQQPRQQPALSPFQQALIATLGRGNVPPELLDSRYQQQAPYPPPRVPYGQYDPRYQQPYAPQPYPYQQPYSNPYSYDPRYPYPARDPYQPRTPYYDPGYQQQDDSLLLRMLLAARYPPPVPQQPVPQVQAAPHPVERSPVYGQRLVDSTTAPSAHKTRLGAVRNVQILDPIHDSESSPSRTTSSTAKPH